MREVDVESKITNNALPAWLLAAVVAAGMTAYADDCGGPVARPKPAPSVMGGEDPNASADTLPPTS